jgi:hypothetical protein
LFQAASRAAATLQAARVSSRAETGGSASPARRTRWVFLAASMKLVYLFRPIVLDMRHTGRYRLETPQLD